MGKFDFPLPFTGGDQGVGMTRAGSMPVRGTGLASLAPTPSTSRKREGGI